MYLFINFTGSKTRCFVLLFVILAAGLLNPLRGQEQSELELAIVEMSTNHPAVRSEALRLSARLKAASFASRTYPDPSIEFSTQHSSGDETMWNPDFAVRRMFRDAREFRISQPIPFPGRLTLGTRIADLEAEAQRLQLGIEKNELIEQFLSALVEIKTLKEILAVTGEISEKMRIMSDAARARYAAGEGSLADVSRANLRRQSYLQRMSEIESMAAERTRELDYFVFHTEEMPEHALHHPSAVIRLMEKPRELTAYLDRIRQKASDSSMSLEDQSLEIALAKIQENRQENEKSLAKMNYLPDFELFAGYRREDFHTSDFSRIFRENFVTAGVSIRLPLWSGLSNHLQVESRDYDLRAARASSENILRRHHAEFYAVRERILSDRQRIEIYSTGLVPQAEQARDSSFLAYQAGRVDFSTVLESWDNLYMQKTEKIRLEGDAARRVLMLAKILNILIPETQNEKPENE